MKVYKVVYAVYADGRNGSFWLCSDAPGHVWYEQGKATVPNANCGPLAAFRTLAAAQDFKDKMGTAGLYGTIWEAEAIRNSVETSLWQPSSNSAEEVRRLERKRLPKGTVLCDAIKLIKKIK